MNNTNEQAIQYLQHTLGTDQQAAIKALRLVYDNELAVMVLTLHHGGKLSDSQVATLFKHAPKIAPLLLPLCKPDALEKGIAEWLAKGNADK